MISRIIWIIAMLVIAGVTSYAQLDRQSRVSPGLAANVPEMFRAFAQTHVTTAALQGEDAERALAEAKRLVERRPIPAEHLRLLALAQYKAEQPQAATISIQLAAQRGWRNPQVQESMLRLALSAGETEEAARRYAALMLSKSSEDRTLEELSRALFEDSAAVDTLAGLLAGEARWKSKFLERGAQVVPPAPFTKIIDESAERGARYECAGLKSAQAIVRSRDVIAATSLDGVIAESC